MTQPRLLCFKLGVRVGDPHFPKRFFAALRMGAYLRVVQEGDVGANNPVRVSDRPSHGVTLRVMTEALRHDEKAAKLRAVARLPEFWSGIVEGE